MQMYDDFFAIRLTLPGGCIPADQLSKVAELTRKYGQGVKFVSPPGRRSRFLDPNYEYIINYQIIEIKKELPL